MPAVDHRKLSGGCTVAQVPLQTPGAPPTPPGSVTGLSAGVNQSSAALVHAPEGEFDEAGVSTGAIAGWVLAEHRVRACFALTPRTIGTIKPLHEQSSQLRLLACVIAGGAVSAA